MKVEILYWQSVFFALFRVFASLLFLGSFAFFLFLFALLVNLSLLVQTRVADCPIRRSQSICCCLA